MELLATAKPDEHVATRERVMTVLDDDDDEELTAEQVVADRLAQVRRIQEAQTAYETGKLVS